MVLALRPVAGELVADGITLTTDWSAVPQYLREHIQFPPFDSGHLENSLKHLSELAAGAESELVLEEPSSKVRTQAQFRRPLGR